MRRRDILFTPLLVLAAAAPEFPASVEMAGRTLVLNGTGTRVYSPLGIGIYRAALYLTALNHDAGAILASSEPKRLYLHYLHHIDASRAVEAWEASFADNCHCPIPPAFRARIGSIDAGTGERYDFLPEALSVAVNDGKPVVIPGASAAVLATFLGPAPPTEALKKALLGLS